VILVKNRFCETLQQATTFVKHGHVRVGPEVVTDPSFLVSRTYEDFITWADTSKIRKTIQKYHDEVDDYED
jgi:U3 small nucleolar ribonucleoprotein protein IMP3